MTKKISSAFFAYPGHPEDLVATIDAAAKIANSNNSEIKIITWPEMGVFGSVIPDQVRANIRSADVLVFDVTRPNQNVYYEAGYAIGLGKAVAPVV